MRRRHLLALFLTAPAWPIIDASSSAAQDGGPCAAPTPPCGDDDGETPETSEGPFYRSGAPDRHDLVAPGVPGDRITIAGAVLDTVCRPVAGAVVQVWHADVAGDYSGSNNRFRGAHRTDARGRWWFSTIVPALYDGRMRHYHFKIQKPGSPVLTTQLFFPSEARNASDYAFDDRLLMQITRTADGQFGRYDFVA